ncbi:MAG TPA: pseudouridine synthase [Candidatus Avimonas sp.]|jgi:23S rRNA pseudouridine2605 synthase|nr:rRNA pseudouridine synthase [Clostridiales bacterium]HOB35904.1 pseudouridine synthase [Candidatus Avimonas sp.]HQA15364.1 pseudouridine synthase [Candidatus Avimonas sp.]HQD37324.1 pseudouridine synthase [Candidatus Avimonas sp.]
MAYIRLQKLLSECGVASRRKAEEMIIEGRVKLNGRTAGLGDKADPKRDIVTVDGERVRPPERFVYIMLNKPRGYVTTMKDEKGRKCVADLVSDAGARLFPVGRLDRDSEGLLILTNDGEFANSVIHPSKHVPKTYRATLKPQPTDEQLELFRQGMYLEGEDTKTAPAEIRIVSGENTDGTRSERVVAEVVLHEGRNRQIRRMFESMDIEVARLRRIAIGQVRLGGLKPGKWRELEPAEVRSLLKAAQPTRPGTAGMQGGQRDGSRPFGR